MHDKLVFKLTVGLPVMYYHSETKPLGGTGKHGYELARGELCRRPKEIDGLHVIIGRLWSFNVNINK